MWRRLFAGTPRAAPGLALAIGFLLSCALAIAASCLGSQEFGPPYYGHSVTIVDLPMPEIVADLPELKGLEPARDHQQLAPILGRAGDAVVQGYRDLPNVAADEEITERQYGYNGRLAETTHHHYSYLIVVEKELGQENLREYRADDQMKPLQPQAPETGFALTSNFASMWVLFYPQNRMQSRFRYLGDQTVRGRKQYAIAFAERPESAGITGVVNALGRSAVLLYQGVAWIDATTFQIAKMRLDLLEPRLDVGLEQLTTEIEFGAVRIPTVGAVLWLPQSVNVTVVSSGQVFRNRHIYSNFKLFTVNSEVRSALH